MVLRLKSLAPTIELESWVHGPPTNFQSGKVYVVAFWAAESESCLEAIPHLMELQEKHKEEGLEVIGVATCERGSTPEEDGGKLNAWLTNMFPNLNYRVALDATGETNKLWTSDSSSLTVPISFVVDRGGHIAYIGHPTQLDEALPKVLEGTCRAAADSKPAHPETPCDKPLVVDLDGSLLLTDMLYESALNALPALGLRGDFAVIWAAANGKAAVKDQLARSSELDYATLPYNACVLEFIQAAKARGRKVYIATAANARHAKGIADHLGVFDGWFASDTKVNLSGRLKAEILMAAFGKYGFDYIGNDASDLPVWELANKAYGVGLSNSVRNRLVALKGTYVALEGRKADTGAWFRALRAHQYVKNLLIFVPALTSHQIALANMITDVIAFLAFCACASAVYILNDLLDLRSDRAHVNKRGRPFASGLLQLHAGLLMIPALFFISLMLATTISLEFVEVLLGYFMLTSAYSIYFKRQMLMDVIVLAMLYATRIVAGGVAVEIQISQWLLTFSIFIFTSLALIKRYVELATRLDRGLPDRSNRDYKIGDLDVVAALIAAAGLNAVTIFAFYVTSPDVQTLYRHPKALWLICPILLYWIARNLMMAHRRLMDDDPIVFALRDRMSAISIGSIVAIVLIAI
ncbi:UbiA family prenyltransferase [Bradyrhizobium sp. NBAIM01]|uniref:UbiA family prenyltransferase n=1 Tax=Bradyrhizobium sp. NBAIM01 TaxID=2793818 RepID=UPI001CD4321C|nr:UbiA family prenyltransferase [Bradyrhizobium sp. NBAIM01]MCA1510373.1 UbiA family prenyltransferase [Bradyrhizobium sp. NBAIM01]